MNPCNNNDVKKSDVYPTQELPHSPGNFPRLHPDDIAAIARQVIQLNQGQDSPTAGRKPDGTPPISEEESIIRGFVGGLVNEVFTHFDGCPDLQNKIVIEFRQQMFQAWDTWYTQEAKKDSDYREGYRVKMTQLEQALSTHKI